MTAVQTTTDVAPMRGIGHLPPEIQHALQLRKMRNVVAAKIAGMSWGEKIDDETRRAVAEWGQQFRVDVTTEIFILGNRVYVNAAFYLRRLSELIADGLVEYAIADHVEDDPRLKQLGPEGEGEYSRRLRERIKYAVPDKAASAVVFRVKLRSMDLEVAAAKWCGNGTRKNDPVGEAFPVESAESRAARRCMRLIVSHVPAAVAGEIEAIEGSAAVLSERVAVGRARVKDQSAREIAEQRAPQMIASGTPEDPYSLDAREKVSEVKSATTPESREGVDRASPQSTPAARQQPASAPARDVFDDDDDRAMLEAEERAEREGMERGA